MAFSFNATPAASSAPSGFSFGTNTASSLTPNDFNFNNGTCTSSSVFNRGSTTSVGAPGFHFGATQGSGQSQAGGGGFGGFSLTTHPGNTCSLITPRITLETTFEVLPDDVKKNMTQFHAFLKEQDQLDAFLKTVSCRPMELLRENIGRLEQQVLARRNRQDRQTSAVQHLRQDVRQLLHQVDAATLSRRSLDNSNNGPAPNMYHVMRRVEMPSPYYWELLDHYEQKMAVIKAQIEDVEAQLKPFDNRQDDAANAGGVPAPAQLQQILMAQNTALMQAAARVAEVHEKAEEMRQLFLAKMQEDLARRGEKNPAAFQNSVRFRTSVAPTIVAPQPVAAAPPATTSAFGFGTTTPAVATTPAPASGFSFSNLSAPAKSVSFNLAGATGTSIAPLAATTSVTATPFAAGSIAAAPGARGFTAPTVATSGFGSLTSSFLSPPATDGKTSVGSKRGSGRAQKKR
ncbi:unnamed protein product [Peronospora belbahrii]|uniref:Nucleoporin Nup54 alpha-helical domain-containing protein n=1 Tax=Peronospora belbahrii TaxID=622444 RepID=A0ABN8D2L6_9STRA|nr:unnamed protein product [Peronospora belbahrii]